MEEWLSSSGEDIIMEITPTVQSLLESMLGKPKANQVIKKQQRSKYKSYRGFRKSGYNL